MANQEDIDRAEAGKEVWNAWAEEELKKPRDQRVTADFSGAPISGIDFSGFVFPGNTNFQGATFKNVAFFEGATFNSLANFKGATFNGLAYFEGATFNSLADFQGATFEGLTIFNNATFNNKTIFEGATFQIAPSFHNAAIHQDTAFSSGKKFFNQFPDIKSYDAKNDCDEIDAAERAYRTLKLAMNKYQSHTEEAGFFKLELMARAKKEPWYRKWMYGAYDLFSDYGQSVSKPIIWWAGLGLAMFVIYALVLGKPGEAATVALAQAIPLIGVEKEALKEALKVLFPPDGNAPFWFQISRATHMLVSSALIFLMLLALRNRFKIK